MKQRVRINQLFEVKSGDFHAVSELDKGTTPLVSCGDVNHGFIGHFDIPPEKRYSDTITVSYNGEPLTAKFRPYEFGAKDDIGVLMPRDSVGKLALVYIAARLNSMRWRFSYGRKCFKAKLSQMEIEVPVVHHNGGLRIDETYIQKVVGIQNLDKRPELVNKQGSKSIPSMHWETRPLSDIFELKRGDFHSLKSLEVGSCATVSRTESDNGVKGHYEQPEGSTRYSPGLITVSTVSGDAFVQVKEFIATDNVIVCIPSSRMKITTAYFIASMIKHQRWRYNYGRQCYKDKLSALTIQVPWRDGQVDEDVIEEIVKTQPYWPYVRNGQQFSF